MDPPPSQNGPRNIVPNWFVQAPCRSPEPVGMSALEVEGGTRRTAAPRVAPKGEQEGGFPAPGASVSG